MAITVNDNFRVNAPKPIDERYLKPNLQPYQDIDDVNNTLALSRRCIGLTVNIQGVEYWYRDGITNLDLVEKVGGSSDKPIVVDTYDDLPSADLVPNQFYWVSNSQGSQWLPGNLGGTYYPKGLYYSNGLTWEYIEKPIQASQTEVDEGINNTKFITPFTFENAEKWNTVGGSKNIDGGTAISILINLDIDGGGA